MTQRRDLTIVGALVLVAFVFFIDGLRIVWKNELLSKLVHPPVATVEAAFYDFEQITVDNTSGGKSLTAAKVNHNGFLYVQCRVRTAEISFLTVDPTQTPVTSSVGQLAEPGDVIRISSQEEARNLRVIRTGSTSGQIDCSYKYNQP